MCVRCLVLASAEGDDGDWSQAGWTCIPVSLISEMVPITSGSGAVD
ncbi:MAG: hypothetical protein KBD01_13790 [Acidobacteria bacterium]|nr:hypothetical protein [Acidobacteriota bacterium]